MYTNYKPSSSLDIRLDQSYPRVVTHSENSGNFQVEENLRKLRETQGISGNFDIFFKLRETHKSFVFF